MLERKNLEPKQFAKAYGISRTQVFNWLARDTPPLPKHWPRLAEFFGVSEEFLITGVPAGSEKVNPVEPRPGKGDGGRDEVDDSLPIMAEIRDELEELLKKAKGQPQRLHWIAEQFHEHLAAPKSWRTGKPDTTKGARRIPLTERAQKELLSSETGRPIQRPLPHPALPAAQTG